MNRSEHACEAHELPELGCDGCEFYFCADCAIELTLKNSGYGMDLCYECEDNNSRPDADDDTGCGECEP